MLKKPSPIEFFISAGSAGIVSAAATIAFLCVTIYEHEEKHEIPAIAFLILAGSFFCYGAYIAWANERRERIELDLLLHQADIRGQIIRASIDTKFYENGAWHSVERGICITMLIEAVNHSQVDAWNGKWPTVDVSFGAETYSGTFKDLPQHPYVLEFNDPTFALKQINGIFHSVWVGGSDWMPGRPRYGYMCFVVPGIDHNIMKLSSITASITIHIYDSLGRDHRIRVEDIPVAKELVRMYTPPQQPS